VPARLTDEELLRRLVAFDSSTGRSTAEIAGFVCEYVDRPGVRITRNPAPEGENANLVIAAGPDDRSRRGLVLSGHLDTVPAGEPGWRSDPFTLTRAADRYVGRGTCDMKGFLALALNRFAAVDPARLRRQLVLIFTYDEELGTLGARRLAETWPDPEALPRAGIVGEPTSLRVVRMHKGHLKLRLRLEGAPAHSAYPHLGRNAIEQAGAAIVALADLRHTLERERSATGRYFGEVPHATLNVARVSGGVAINVVPEQCVVEIGVRLLPGMGTPEMVERVRGAVARAVGRNGFELELVGDSPPLLLDPDAGLHEALCRRMGQRESIGVSFATDAGWLQRLGLECVVFGPGAIAEAHRPNESLPVAEFVRAGELLEELVRDACAATAP